MDDGDSFLEAFHPTNAFKAFLREIGALQIALGFTRACSIWLLALLVILIRLFSLKGIKKNTHLFFIRRVLVFRFVVFFINVHRTADAIIDGETLDAV